MSWLVAYLVILSTSITDLFAILTAFFIIFGVIDGLFCWYLEDTNSESSWLLSFKKKNLLYNFRFLFILYFGRFYSKCETNYTNNITQKRS